ncbi:MAG TPA: hypothetical protein VL943_12560, partial [Niabella sp.]|nr:hypothetical protein [Niabella sp.]
MSLLKKTVYFISLIYLLAACGNSVGKQEYSKADSNHSCMKAPSRFGVADSSGVSFGGDTSLAGMVLIPGGVFDMGGDNNQAS